MSYCILIVLLKYFLDFFSQSAFKDDAFTFQICHLMCHLYPSAIYVLLVDQGYILIKSGAEKCSSEIVLFIGSSQFGDNEKKERAASLLSHWRSEKALIVWLQVKSATLVRPGLIHTSIYEHQSTQIYKHL